MLQGVQSCWSKHGGTPRTHLRLLRVNLQPTANAQGLVFISYEGDNWDFPGISTVLPSPSGCGRDLRIATATKFMSYAAGVTALFKSGGALAMKITLACRVFHAIDERIDIAIRLSGDTLTISLYFIPNNTVYHAPRPLEGLRFRK